MNQFVKIDNAKRLDKLLVWIIRHWPGHPGVVVNITTPYLHVNSQDHVIVANNTFVDTP